MKNKIDELLKPYYQRYKIKGVIKIMLRGINLGLILGLFLVALSKFLVLKNLWFWVFVGIAITCTLSLVYGLILRQDKKLLSKSIDQLGFDQRIETYEEFKKIDSMVVEEQRQDTLAILNNNIDFAKEINLRPKKIELIISCVLIILIIGGSFVETYATEKTKSMVVFEEKKTQIEKEIDEKKDVLKDKLDEDAFAELEKQLEALKKSLKEAENLEDAKKESLKAKKEIKKLMDQEKEKKLKEAISKVAEKEIKKKLEDLLENNDLKEFSKALNNLKLDEDLMNELKSMLQETDIDLSELLKDIKDLDQLLESLGEMGDDQELGDGDGEGNGNGQGKGKGTGKGEGEGTGQGYSPGSGDQEEAEPGDAQDGLDGEANNSKVKGDLSGIEESQRIKLKNFGTEAGDLMNYSEIISDYQEKEFRKLDNVEIPPNMKAIIKEYFSE